MPLSCGCCAFGSRLRSRPFVVPGFFSSAGVVRPMTPRYQNMRFEMSTCSISGRRAFASLMCDRRYTARSTWIGYRANVEKPGDVGDDVPEPWWWNAFADFEVPSSAAAAAGPAVEKLDTEVDSSCFFLLPNSDPRKRSFSFFGFSDLSWCRDFLPNRPFFFSLTGVDVDPTEAADEFDSVRVKGGRSMCAIGAMGEGIAPVRCCIDMPGGAVCDRGGAAPEGRSCFSGTAGFGGDGTRPVGGAAC